MLRTLLIPLLFLMAACASTATEVRHLSPQFKKSAPPRECRLISILKDSPAERAGLKVGDRLVKVNGEIPNDASAVSDLVAKAPVETNFEIAVDSAPSKTVHATLNSQHPRLGAACDLNGWEKAGLSSAGNESLTLFEGFYAVTLSGIVDDVKQLTLLRAHIVNHGDTPVHVGPDIFAAQDGMGKSIAILMPTQVMCELYGEKGARLLSQQTKRHNTLDADTGIPAEDAASDLSACEGLGKIGRMSNAKAEYVRGNVKSVAEDSLWPSMLAPESTADGLVYAMAPSALPLFITVSLPDHVFKFQLGTAQASTQVMPAISISKFFEAQKRGTPLRLTLKKGKVFIGKFTSYDSLEEIAWFNAPSDSLLNSVSFPLRSIRSVEKLEQQ